MRSITRAALVLAAIAEPATAQSAAPANDVFRLEEIARGLDGALYLTAPAGDRRLFVVEQPGRIRVIANGRLLPRPFLDITDRVSSGGERGLLSVAFHPRYASTGTFFVNYTDRQGDTRVERYAVTRDPDVADPASARLVLGVDQPYSNHNGGLVMFGPDGMLYIGMGDGGSGGDPQGFGQRLDTHLGKVLRIDVDRGDPYAVPPDNPFVGRGDARPEIWATGLRNPWRFAFDRATRLLYIADVGQSAWEEVNVVSSTARGVNYGWKEMEGAHCYGFGGCKRDALQLPALEYGHGDGCSITGGFVYRGTRIPALVGHYFYSDYCNGWLRSFRFANARVNEERRWTIPSIGSVLSFGEDADGELYVLTGGKVWKLVPAR